MCCRARLIEIGVDAKVARRVRCVTFDALAQQVLQAFEGVEPPFSPATKPWRPTCVPPSPGCSSKRPAPLAAGALAARHNDLIFEFLTPGPADQGAHGEAGLDDGRDHREERAELLGIPEGVFLLYRHLGRARRATASGRAGAPSSTPPTIWPACCGAAGFRFPLPEYRIVIVDELQDMNPATYVVLEHLLARGNAFFTGAGDFDQVIHRWAGADRFHPQRVWPGLAQRGIPAAHAHLPPWPGDGPGHRRAEEQGAVVSGRAHETRLRVVPYADPRDAADKVVADIVDWKNRGGQLDACAVVLRALPVHPHRERAARGRHRLAGGGLESYLLRSRS